MAHQEQVDFCTSVKKNHSQFFKNKIVLDVGSLDINGNNQYLFESCMYIGVDLMPGRNVDFSSKGHELGLPDESIDVIVSTECFEHDQFYALTLKNIVRMLKPGGMFVFSCATTGRPEHGTRRTTPQDAPFTQDFSEWCDYYKNLEEIDIRAILNIEDIFKNFSFSTESKTCDLYFWGIKRGELNDRSDYSFQIKESNLQFSLQATKDLVLELTTTLAANNQQIVDLNQTGAEQVLRIANLDQTIVDRGLQIEELNQTVSEKNLQIIRFNQDINERDQQILHLNRYLVDRDSKLARLINSNSWNVTKPLRFFGRLARGNFSIALAPFKDGYLGRCLDNGRKALQAVPYILRGDFAGLQKRFRAGKNFRAISNIYSSTGIPRDVTRWGIMATQHTQFIAHLLQQNLSRHGWDVEVTIGVPKEFDRKYYIVICPQMFEKLPPGEKRIAFQMEQSVSSRWFTDEYINILESSFAVLEYALVNIDFMATKGVVYPQVHYLPVGASKNYFNDIDVFEKNCDVLFYGDCNSSPRRQEMINALKQYFKVKIVSEVFGDDMKVAIRSSRLVINLHYYENALLEMPRIQECLSLGVPVVSESSQDQSDYPELKNVVRFFNQGSIPEMLKAVEESLKNPVAMNCIESAVNQSSDRFAFMIDRFLIAMDFLSPMHTDLMKLPIPPSAPYIGLSLPETIKRRRIFESERPSDCVVFDGIRCRPGWVGCGLSYKAIAQHALKYGNKRITIMEDDVILPPDFEEKMIVVNEFLIKNSTQWDVFAGVIASLHEDAKVVAVEAYGGITFVTINKMTSTVFNIYSEKVLRILASWNPMNLDSKSNTIDRFLESQADLRVVVALPFFVGHREEVHSTLWGFQNTQYSDWISNSESQLKTMTDAFNN